MSKTMNKTRVVVGAKPQLFDPALILYHAPVHADTSNIYTRPALLRLRPVDGSVAANQRYIQISFTISIWGPWADTT